MAVLSTDFNKISGCLESTCNIFTCNIYYVECIESLNVYWPILTEKASIADFMKDFFELKSFWKILVDFKNV